MHRWVAVMVLFSGCAFGLSGPDPDRPHGKMPKCDTSKALVVVDGLMASAAGVVTIALAGETEPAVALLPLSVGAIYAAGAIRGNSNVNKCRAAMGEFESYAAARETLPMQPPGYDEGPRAPVAPEVGMVAPQGELGRAPAPQPVAPPVPKLVVPPAPTEAPPTTEAASPQPAQPQPPPTAKPSGSKAPASKAPAAKAAQKTPQDDWGDFWREVE